MIVYFDSIFKWAPYRKDMWGGGGNAPLVLNYVVYSDTV